MLPCGRGLRLYLKNIPKGHEKLSRIYAHQTNRNRQYRQHPELICDQGGEEQPFGAYLRNQWAVGSLQ